LRFAGGFGVAADANFGRALLLRAADGGFPDARRAADELAAQTSEQQCRVWYARLRDNLGTA